jgi:cob(I)alamin adenosyltransferase
LILDEINYAINLGLVSVKEVTNLMSIKPKELTLILTGNHAPLEIIDMADLVTEMKEVKHPYKLGIKAKKGIDF